MPGDFKCTKRNVINLTIAGCLIGFVTALTGIGPGVMTNVVLLRLDMHPLVAAETGQALGIPIAFASSICMLIYGRLKIDYGILQAILTIIATFIGMYLQDLTVKRSGGKYQYSILIMVISVIVTCVSMSSLTMKTIVDKHSEGVSVFDFQGYC